MRSSSLGVLACIVALHGCGTKPPVPPLPPISASRCTEAQAAASPEAANLPATEEVSALLAGDRESGICTNVARIAVPPLTVLGDDQQQWMGEAAAELIASRLSHSEGTSVLERGELKQLIEEIERNRGESSDEVIAKGKLLGARMLVTGKLFPASSETYKGVIKAVDTETGVWLPSVEFDVPKAAWTEAVAKAAGRLAKGIGTKASANAPPAPLSPDANEIAAKALKLQQEGKLLEAQPLFAQALPKPTSAWRYEAEYLSLMNDLGLKAWVADRADRVLASMPINSETSCDRARILTERYRLEEKGDVNGMRKALRVAASCGDPNVVARTLVRYSQHLDDVHNPSGDAAVAKAESMLESLGDVAACSVRFEVVYRDGDRNLKATNEGRWREIAKFCEKAGDLRSASIAYGNAGVYATSSTTILQMKRKAVEVGKLVGGSKLDGSFVSLASELRSNGYPTEADQMLLSAMERRLKQLIKLHGGLPDPAARLDADLLKRAGITDLAPATKNLDPSQKLLSDAYHASLGTLVKEWGKRTRPESKLQADAYEALAGKMDPDYEPETDDESEGEAKFEKRLAKAGLKLEDLTEGAKPPLRGTDLRTDKACQALWDWYWYLNGKGAEQSAKRGTVVQALKTAAAWLERPQWELNAMRLEGRYLADIGKVKEASLLMESATRKAANNQRMLYWTLGDQIYVEDKVDAKRAQEVRTRRLEVAKAFSDRVHVDALYDLSYASIGKDQAAVKLGEDGLLKAVDRFKQAKEYENAAYTLQRLAWIDRYAKHADGTESSVHFMAERSQVVAQLKDPQRLLEAQADSLKELADYYFQIYRGSARRQLDADYVVSDVMALIGERASKAAAEGRQRDAARVVARLPSSISAVEKLSKAALDWSKSFEESAEYPSLVGKLYMNLSSLARNTKEQQEHRRKASKAFLDGKDYGNALWTLRLAMRNATSADEMKSFLKDCKTFEVEKDPGGGADCPAGALEFLAANPKTSADDAREIYSFGKSRLGIVDKAYIPTARIDYRGNLAVAAVLSGDTAYARELVEYARNYYTRVSYNAYMFVTFLSRTGTAIRQADPVFATELYLEFDRTPGASSYWKATEYDRFADTARRAKNAEAEKAFLEAGRRYATYSPQQLHQYDMYPAIAAYEKKDWKAIDQVYKNATKLQRERYPKADAFLIELDRQWALVKAYRKQNSTALKLLEPHIKRIQSGVPPLAGPTPCRDVLMLQTAAGIARAAGQCKKAEELQTLAEQRKPQCTKDDCFTMSAITGVWCDRVSFSEFKPANECRKPMTDREGDVYH